jgi:hypothetical protein
MHTLLVAFGALVIATIAAALLAPAGITVERPFLPAHCAALRLAPIVRCLRRRRPS